MVKVITSMEDFETALEEAEARLVIVDFTAIWCGPCQNIKPAFEKLSEKNPDVVFLKVDVDENPEVTEKYGVRSMPTFLFIKKCEVVYKFTGADEAKLKAKMEEYK